jgi:PIN domain nuclease of toxin-antitoxin system
VSFRLLKLQLRTVSENWRFKGRIWISFAVKRRSLRIRFNRSTPLNCGLPWHHKDAFDRLIIATALSDDLPLISIDGEFRKYKGLKVIWQEKGKSICPSLA